MANNIKQIIEAAIPLTPNCEIKRKDEIQRRVKLRLDIEELLREEKKKQPFKPDLEFKSSLQVEKMEIKA